MARVVRFAAFGGPEALSVDEVDVAPPGPGEVRIKVGAVGLNRVETMYLRGGFGPADFPATIGYEAAGIIDQVGSDVADFAPGDRVATIYGLSMAQYGTCADTILYPADRLIKLPEGLSLVDAAASVMQYGTAHALIAIAEMTAGDHVVISAASSSVGLAAIQIANSVGAIPIATTRKSDKKSRLLELGARHVIVTDEEDTAERVLLITGGAGARIFFDAVGGSNLASVVPAMSQQGIAIVYGLLGGLSVELPLAQLMQANLTVRGWSADIVTGNPERRAKLVDFLLEFLGPGGHRPVIAKTVTLDEVGEAYRYLESNAQVGKVVVIARPDLK